MPTTTIDPKTAPSHTAAERRSETIDVRFTDPQTGMPWPYYMDAMTVERYLNLLGIPISKQTLAHKRAKRIGLRWKYAGQRPIVTRDELLRYIREELFQDQSPLAGKRGRRGRPSGSKRNPAKAGADEAADGAA
jgi:hypothetical protein